jgi:PncC family amidohydrolase
MEHSLDNISYHYAQIAQKYGIKTVTAESCTAGLISATIANVPGSSAWLDRGYVVYTPEAKCEMLGVAMETIEEFNITSENVAREMSLGALDRSNANFSFAVTGIAGPAGGTEEIPVGTICMAWCYNRGVENKIIMNSETKLFIGSRNEIRESVVIYMIKKAIVLISDAKD